MTELLGLKTAFFPGKWNILLHSAAYEVVRIESKRLGLVRRLHIA